MHTNRYLPGRYKHYRRRRIRNRLLIAGAALAAVALLVVGIYFGIKTFVPHTDRAALTVPSQPIASASNPAAATSTAVQTQTLVPTASPAPTATATPTATPTPVPTPTPTPKPSYPPGLIINIAGMTIESRFVPPQGFDRVPGAEGSFAAWLRTLKLKPHGTVPKIWNGKAKKIKDYAAVLDMEINPSNLQQSAETVLRLDAEYKFSQGKHQSILYHFASGFAFPWERFRQGERLSIQGSAVSWTKTATANSSPAVLQEYLTLQFNYTNMHSLSAYDLISVKPADVQPGDLLLNTKGAMAIIVDVAINPKTKEKCLLLLTGFNPAQQPQILMVPGKASTPWFKVPATPGGELVATESKYDWILLKRFKP